MSGIAYLAWRYLAYHRIKTGVLIAAVTVIIYLPIGLNLLLHRTADQLMSRAEAAPLLIGARGSRLELVLNSLYFESDAPATIRFDEAERVEASGWANSIPLDTRFRTAGGPIVGTTLDYFEFRGLRLANGRMMATLGECVLGAAAARAADVGPGGHVLSLPETVLDIAGVYPLKMRVVGVLEPSGTPDDRAVFVDVMTTWTIQGLAHGHQDLTTSDAADQVLRLEEGRIVASAAVVEYREITPENIGDFHFHGDPATFPLTAVIVRPRDQRAGILLEGRYLDQDQPVQIVRPAEVLEDLVKTVFAVGRYVTAGIVMVSLATLATITLVFVLSLQLRRREIETMRKIGGGRGRIAAVLMLEIASVLLAGALLAAILAGLTGWASAAFTRALILLS
jgi:putative ABC transport system permease protein